MATTTVTVALLIFTYIVNISSLEETEHPNILFIYVDDVGFNDFGWNGNTLTQTPFLDNLVSEESLLIDHNYVSFVCSPTRAQMLSGRYASHLGLQHNVFTENVPYSLTRQVSLLSNEFQANGYSTHLIGKYHLGFQAWEYTPTYRGFDTFQGFYNGEETYNTHQAYVKGTDLMYYDLRDNEDPDPDITDYSVYLQRDKYLSLMDDIDTNNNDNPFFIYLAFQAAHFPPQAPDKYASLYCDPFADDTDIESNTRHNKDIDRVKDEDSNDVYLPGDCTTHDIHMAQMTSIDDAMEIIINRLKQDLNIWDNTLIFFSSDNGAAMFSGDNAPLRGGKGTPFEGGVRVPGFVTGGYLNQDRKGQVLNEFPVHVTDWYQTLLSASNIELNYERSKKLHASSIDIDSDDEIDTKWDYIDDYNIEIPIDGKDIWNAIQNNIIDDELLGREILLHLDEIDCDYESCGALIYQNWKYLRGPYICESVKCGWNNNWLQNPNNNILNCPMTITNDDKLTNIINRKMNNIEYNNDYHDDGDFTFDDNQDPIDWSTMTCRDGCLFDLSTDPCEYNNLINDEELIDIVELMENKLLLHQQQSVLPLMNENEIVLDNDQVRPTLVCDSEYWCPYMEYDDVEFELTLFKEYMRLYGPVDDDHHNNHLKQDNGIPISLLYTLGLSTCIGLCCVIYINWLRPNMEDINIINKQSHPLLQKL